MYYYILKKSQLTSIESGRTDLRTLGDRNEWVGVSVRRLLTAAAHSWARDEKAEADDHLLRMLSKKFLH